MQFCAQYVILSPCCVHLIIGLVVLTDFFALTYLLKVFFYIYCVCICVLYYKNLVSGSMKMAHASAQGVRAYVYVSLFVHVMAGIY